MNNDECPVLISPTVMAEAFGVHPVSVYRWNTPATPDRLRLPAPDKQLGQTVYWFEATVREYAKRRGLVLDEDVLRRECQNQTGRESI